MGGAIYFDAQRWNGSSYDGGNMHISNSTFHGNYLDSGSENFGNLFGAAIVYGRWNSNTDSKSYIFNTVITGSRVLLNGNTFNTTDSNQLNSNQNQKNDTTKYPIDILDSNGENVRIYEKPEKIIRI